MARSGHQDRQKGCAWGVAESESPAVGVLLHHGNRILNTRFAGELAQAIRVGGLLKLTTDDSDYFQWACGEVDRCRGWKVEPGWTGRDEPTSEFEEQFKIEGRNVYRRAWARE
ncbi:MAG: hypothetical protein EBT69_04640 [Verrucomicrobia bacterium]|nr:hypothetical protein [Verrucomicrobiota bacterium]